nr:phosphotyrosine protein phosphatase [Allomuricauda sp.]
MKKILFICSANKQRSKTAQDYFSKEYPHFEFKSAGTNLKACAKEGTTPLTEEMLKWADKVYLMEERHKSLINNHVGPIYDQKMAILNIPDRFSYMDQQLLDILVSKIKLG